MSLSALMTASPSPALQPASCHQPAFRNHRLGDGWGERYKKPVQYEEVAVAEYAVGVLQRVAHQAEEAQRFLATVSDECGAPLGGFLATRAALYAMKGRRGGGIAVDRRLAELDTLGDAKMWLRVEGEAVRVGGGRTRPAGPKIVLP